MISVFAKSKNFIVVNTISEHIYNIASIEKKMQITAVFYKSTRFATTAYLSLYETSLNIGQNSELNFNLKHFYAVLRTGQFYHLKGKYIMKMINIMLHRNIVFNNMYDYIDTEYVVMVFSK